MNCPKLYSAFASILACLVTISSAGYGSDGENTDHFDYKVVCYYSVVGSWYRRGRAMYLPSDVDAHLCTHINYDHAILEPDTLLMVPKDTWADIDNELYKKVTDLRLKNPSLKVLLTIGGWEEKSLKYSRLANDPKARSDFTAGVVDYLKLHRFDGLDFAWFYPGCWDWGQNCSLGQPTDRRNLVLLMQELKEAFDRQQPRLILSMAVASDPEIIRKAYDVPGLSRYADFFNVMTFDYNTDLDVTGHQAKFYSSAGDANRLDNANETLYYWLKKGAPKRKLVMGVPSYARTLTLKSGRQTSLGSLVKGKGNPGELTKSEGLLAYYEVCDRLLNMGWVQVEDPLSGPYAYYGDQWMSYDDPKTVAKKGNYIKSHGFGGMMIWDLDRDDFKGSCFGVKSPITRAAHNAFIH